MGKRLADKRLADKRLAAAMDGGHPGRRWSVARGLSTFSTADLPAEQRIGLWEDHNRAALIGLRCRMLGEDPFDGAEQNLQLDRVHLARVRGNAHVVERPAEVIRRSPADAIAVYVAVAGEAFFYHGDGVLVLKPGQVLICDADRPFMRGFSRGLEELAIKVPRGVFEASTGLAELRGPVVREERSARTLGRLAHRTLRDQVANERDRAVDERDRAVGERDRAADEESLLALVASMVGSGRDPGAVHLANARAFIEEHLTEIGLTAARVAAGAGISERHLSRAFASSGTSLPQFVLGRRLERAKALLAASPSMTVAEVAVACGFGSAAHFSHVFRERFGVRASEIRRAAGDPGHAAGGA
ncbi:helix-turn-helix domain-containing protein [Actinoplanes sp. NPDC023714]|uniref:helix-turn-helix domain-containing protein n=1 Tax=Actinoplanes sp. NPDC023714 TaxID=3154322 RepID=UPI003402FB46